MTDKKTCLIDGKAMAYTDAGSGRPVVFLHGNPTSSYLWRNIIPHVAPHARCLAPDLIGHGDSDKLDEPGPTSYTFAQHRRYLDGLLDQLELGDDVTLVVHDWGSGLGFDWANRHRARVAGIAYMEAIVMPLRWSDWSEGGRPIFEALRSNEGDDLILNKNLFVEAILPGGVIRPLEADEFDEYRRPFRDAGEGRRPTLTWPRQLPLDGEPADVVSTVASYSTWLAASPVPKLFLNADPGAILVGRQREFCRTWPNQTEVTVTGRHFLQEDSPHHIGLAIAGWLDRH